MKKIIALCGLLCIVCSLYSQSTIDKPTYINKYRIRGTFLRKPLPKRTARKLSAPLCIHNYLWVYPMDLGYFTSHPNEIIKNINQQNKYDRDNWHIPSPDELMLMEENASTIGLGDDVYMCTAHLNGILRLVSTGPTRTQRETHINAKINTILNNGEGKQIDGIIWRTEVYKKEGEDMFRPKEVSSLKFPKGWRLPKYEEIVALFKYNNNNVLLTWRFLENLTSYKFYINDYFRSVFVNTGFILYQNSEGPNAVGFHFGTGQSRPYLKYEEDTWGLSGGYIILVFDKSLL